MNTTLEASDDIASRLSAGRYDFIDFGCSKGGSLAFGAKKLGGTRGLGIDLSPAKVEQTREAGFEACVADARDLALHPDSIRFVTMMDFLEHLPGFRDAKQCIEAACDAATDFIFIRQPWFDSDPYLMSLGLKLYWSDWTGHPNAMTRLELHRILARIPKLRRWKLYARGVISDSSDPCIHSINSPADQGKWNDGYHPTKSHIVFDQPVYQQIGAIAQLNDDPTLVSRIENEAKWSEVIFDSGAQ